MDLTNCFWKATSINVLGPLQDSITPDHGLSFSEWYRVRHTVDHDQKAWVKTVWKVEMRSDADGWKQVMNERLIWSQLSSSSAPFVLPLISFFETESCYCFVARHLNSLCPLSTVIKSSLPPDVIKIMAGQLALAINHVHTHQGILLRSLSPESILVESSGKLWISDLSHARKLSEHEAFTCSRRQKAIAKSRYISKWYMSPEMMRGEYYSHDVDWWAFGVIVFEMLTGVNPVRICFKRSGFPDTNDTRDIPVDHLIQGKLNL